MRTHRLSALVLAPLLLGVRPDTALAQGIHVTPRIGAYLPATNVKELRAAADTVRLEREGDLAYGATLEFGSLRASLDYVSGARFTREGVQDAEAGSATMLAVAADYVLRPIPRLVIVQPYVLGGLGLKRENFDFGANLVDQFDDEDSDVTLHLGIGADLTLGSIGIVAELTDYITRSDGGSLGQHDAFATVGVRLKLF